MNAKLTKQQTCQIRKELEINRCLACLDKCAWGKADIQTYFKHKMRLEAEKQWNQITREMDWR